MSAISNKTDGYQGYVHKLRNLIDDKSEKQKELIEALLYEKDVELVKEIIRDKKNVNYLVRTPFYVSVLQDFGSFTDEYTPLMFATDRGDVEIVKALIDANAGVDCKSGVYGYTALMLAAYHGNIEILKELMKTRPNVDVQTDRDLSHSFTALMLAARKGHLEIVQELIKADAKVDLQDRDHLSALMSALKKNHFDVVKELINAKADLNLSDKHGYTVLMLAADSGLLEIVQELIKAKVDVNFKSEGLFDSRHTALMLAAKKGHLEIVKELINAKASVDLKDRSGRTALIYAAPEGHIEIVKLLIKHGVCVDKNDELWINELENAEIKEILHEASRKNDVIIEKMQEIISEEISKNKQENANSDDNPSLENPADEVIGNIAKRILQEDFDERLYKLEQNHQSNELEIENRINLIAEELKKIKDKTDVVYQKHQQKLELLREQKGLYFNPSIRTFYFTIQALFETRLVCMMLLLGGIIKRSESKTEMVIGGATEVATGALDFIPGGGILGNAITISMRAVLAKMGDDIKLTQAKRIQKHLGNPKGASKFAEYAARKVAQKYEEVIRSKKVEVERAKYAGEKVAKWMFEIIDNERKSAFDYFFVNNVLVPKIDEKHKANNLFEDKKTKKKASKSLNNRVSELASNQQAILEKQEVLDKQKKEFTITSLTQPFLEQFNAKIKEDFPNKTKTKTLFEISRKDKFLKISIFGTAKNEFLNKLNKYLPLFSDKIITDWEIKETEKYLLIKARSTQTAKELAEFFEKSNLPVKINA